MKGVLRAVVVGLFGVSLLGFAVWLNVRPTVIHGAAPAVAWPECRPEQVEVLILGTFHFEQERAVDVMDPERQAQLAEVLEALERFVPRKVAVEWPHARSEELDDLYRRYLAAPDERPEWRNEIAQIGFRLARRLDHERVFAVDVPMFLWDDSLAIFEEEYPRATRRLRAEWDVRHPSVRHVSDRHTLAEILHAANTDVPPANTEMYARYLPLVEDEAYAGALKLRPWYDRNLRIVQNLFRILEPDDERVLLVIGSGHLRVLAQILEFTPQLCAVDPLGFLPAVEPSPVAAPFGDADVNARAGAREYAKAN